MSRIINCEVRMGLAVYFSYLFFLGVLGGLGG